MLLMESSSGPKDVCFHRERGSAGGQSPRHPATQRPPAPRAASRCCSTPVAPARPRGCAHTGPCCSVWESPGSGSTVPAEGINQCSAPVDNVLPTQGHSPAHAPGTSWGWRNWLPCPTASRASRSGTFTAPELLGAGLGAKTCSRGTSGTELSGTWRGSAPCCSEEEEGKPCSNQCQRTQQCQD